MTFQGPTDEQGEMMMLLVDLIGISGVHKQPEQGDAVVFDLLPAAHVIDGGQPFCIKIEPDGSWTRISDEEAGIDERPEFPFHSVL